MHQYLTLAPHLLLVFVWGVQMSVSDGLGSRKLKVLAETAVTLARYHPNIVAADIIKRMLKVGLTELVKPH